MRNFFQVPSSPSSHLCSSTFLHPAEPNLRGRSTPQNVPRTATIETRRTTRPHCSFVLLARSPAPFLNRRLTVRERAFPLVAGPMRPTLALNQKISLVYFLSLFFSCAKKPCRLGVSRTGLVHLGDVGAVVAEVPACLLAGWRLADGTQELGGRACGGERGEEAEDQGS